MPRHFNESFDERYDSDQSLAHFGVKGMRWGHRTGGDDGAGGGGDRSAKRLAKAQTKLAKKTDKINSANERDDSIKSARENLGKTANAVKLAKAQYKVDKHLKGKAAAKEALKSVKNENAATISLAQQKTGQERAAANRELFKSIALGSLQALA